MGRRPRRRQADVNSTDAPGTDSGEDSADSTDTPPPAGVRDTTEVDLRKPVVAVVMGSDSDFPVVKHCIETLEEFDIPYEVRVISAHRTPDKAHKFASTARL